MILCEPVLTQLEHGCTQHPYLYEGITHDEGKGDATVLGHLVKADEKKNNIQSSYLGNTNNEPILYPVPVMIAYTRYW